EGFALAGQRMRDARARGVLVAVLQALALPLWAARRHKKALCLVGNILMPVASAFLLVLTIQYWSGLSFGLALEYEGEKIGYITDASVFDNAAAMVNSRVLADESGNLQVRPPKLTLAVVTQAQVLDEDTVCDKIIETSGDAFAEATGLYVNGELVGALTSNDELNAMLNEYLNAQRTGTNTVEFVQSVTTQSGLYPLSAILTEEGLLRRLEAEAEEARYYTVKAGDSLRMIANAHGMSLDDLLRLNRIEDATKLKVGQRLLIQRAARRLQVRGVTVDGYEETIPFTTRTEKDDTMYEGTRKVAVKGQNGKRYITTETVTVDGQVQIVNQTGIVVLKEPVQEVILIGTKKRAPNSGYTPGVSIQEGNGIVTGHMTWPVPAVRSISQRFHGGHGALDIANGPVTMMNTPIVAADGGRVKEVNTNPRVGYGIYVIIDHGNGLTTMYAHLNSVSVTAGQKVSRGQEIGRGGNTGWSTGPHLHFEVRVNGRCVNPLNYVSTSS
ncbi:MAG: M23 family metallopeptidase, partial [Clostridia bacterium]|nr:M23 family metallopeptidase [Clostridia bacterium]